VNNDGSIDDKTTKDNKDRNKILATIAAIVYEFSARYPDRIIFFVELHQKEQDFIAWL
jgi:hypothetical protein